MLKVDDIETCSSSVMPGCKYFFSKHFINIPQKGYLEIFGLVKTTVSINRVHLLFYTYFKVVRKIMADNFLFCNILQEMNYYITKNIKQNIWQK
jgi:hypothetical protein